MTPEQIRERLAHLIATEGLPAVLDGLSEECKQISAALFVKAGGRNNLAMDRGMSWESIGKELRRLKGIADSELT